MSGATGEALGVDLYYLHRIADELLPDVSGAFRDAASAISGVTPGDGTSAFTWPGRPGGDAVGPVYGPWFAARDALLSIVTTTAGDIDGTAAALHMAVNVYAATDHAAEVELQKEIAANVPPPVPTNTGGTLHHGL